MFPHLTFSLFGDPIVLTTSNAFLVLAFLIALVAYPLAMRRGLPLSRSVTTVILTALSTLLGARLFHVLWERPAYFIRHPLAIFTRADGMTFYGGLMAGVLCLALLIRRETKTVRQRAWDVSAIVAAVLVSVLRISCFAEGCCWGSPTALPWAVRYYDPTSSMPWLGIPVHPVQLYESACGFLIALGLTLFARHSARFRGLLIHLFCIAYAAVRFGLEGFRGDSYRGVNLVLGLSTSQILSVAIGAVALAALARELLRRIRSDGRAIDASALPKGTAYLSRALLLVIAAGLFQACAIQVPQAPDSDVVQSSAELVQGVYLDKMNQGRTPSQRNLVFVAADDQSESLYTGFLKQAYSHQPTPRLEEVAWWLYAPQLRPLYNLVIRVRYDKFSKENLLFALTLAESLGQSYDLVLFTHGLPNNIVTSVGFPLFSWEDLDALQGKLEKLRVVFMQGCFGGSLVPDWQATGAKAVLSYPDLNRNYFYLGFFLEHLAASPEDFVQAYQKTNQAIAGEIKKSALYTKMITILGVSVDEYLRASPNPALSVAPPAPAPAPAPSPSAAPMAAPGSGGDNAA